MNKRIALAILALLTTTSIVDAAEPPTKDQVVRMSGKGYKGEIELAKGKPVTVYYTIRGDGLFQLGYGKPGTSSYLHTGAKYEKKQSNVTSGYRKDKVTHFGDFEHGYEVAIDPFADFKPAIPEGSWHFMWVTTDEIHANFLPAGGSDDALVWVKLKRYN